MANKLAFRARAPDASKPLPIYHVDEIPDLVDAAINRAVPPMPTGMEKNEECEHHLLKAISARQKYGEIGRKDSEIPIPDVSECTDDYAGAYARDATVSKNYIHVPPFSLEPSKPDYDLDSEDEEWFQELKRKDRTFEDFTELEFEEMIDRLEKGSGQNPATIREARRLLKQDDDLIVAVHSYWTEKRARYVASVEGKFDRHGAPLVAPTIYPLVLTSVPLGSAPNNPYVAFRKRTEKMQTRKNRKNDEFAYEKMVKLRRDLMKAITLLEMVKRREKLKREYINLTVEIVEKRYQLRDWKGEILNEVVKSKRSKAEGRGIRTKNSGMVTSKSGQRVMSDVTSRKRSKPEPDDVLALAGENVPPVHIIRPRTPVLGSVVSSPAPPKKRLECVFEFRARPGCKYSFKRSPSPDSTRASAVDPLLDNAKGDERYQFHLASLRFPVDRSLGFTRRRIGRGGRLVLDRPSLEKAYVASSSTAPASGESSQTTCDTFNAVGDGACPMSPPACGHEDESLISILPHYAPVSNARPPSPDASISSSSSSDDDDELSSSCTLSFDDADAGGDWGVAASSRSAREYLLPWSMTFGGPDSDGEDEDEARRVFDEPTSVDFNPVVLEDLESEWGGVVSDGEDEDEEVGGQVALIASAQGSAANTSPAVVAVAAPFEPGTERTNPTSSSSSPSRAVLASTPPRLATALLPPDPRPSLAVNCLDRHRPAAVNPSPTLQPQRVQNCEPRMLVRGSGGPTAGYVRANTVVPLTPAMTTTMTVKPSPVRGGNGGSGANADSLILHKQLMLGRTDTMPATSTSSPPSPAVSCATQIVFLSR